MVCRKGRGGMTDQEVDVDNISVLIGTDADPTAFQEFSEYRAELPPLRPKREAVPRRSYASTAYTACKCVSGAVFMGLYYAGVFVNACCGLVTECLVCGCIDEV